MFACSVSIKRFSESVERGKNNAIWGNVNIYPTAILGRNNSIGSFTEIGDGVVIGSSNRIGAYCFIPWGVTIENYCFIGPRVTFTNDKYPPGGKTAWQKITVKTGAAIGAGAIILPGVTIGKESLVGSGSVVTKDVPDGMVVCGNPAKIRREVRLRD